jgi:hypothetical protein
LPDFQEALPEQLIAAPLLGSTPSRTRLYQIGINRLWQEIRKDFMVWGYKDGDWEDFRSNVNYEAFLVKRN